MSDYLSEIAFERDGYILDSWNTESDGSGAKYSARAYVKNLAADSGAVVTLYAIWTPVAYDVTFNTDPYSSGVDNQAKVLTEITFGGTTTTIVYDTSYTLPVPSADYYTFAGWYTAAGVQLTDGSGVGISPWNVPSDVTVLAKWEKSYAGYTYITTADEFRAIADNLSGKYLLLNDIYLGADWTPMGSYYWEHSNTDNIIAAPFSGVLDGQGHTITYAAVIPASVTAHIDYVYGLFGACDGAKFYGVKLNCSVTSASNPNPNCRECSMGGFAGIAKNTLFENCEILSGSSVLNEHTDETYYAYANMQYTGATYAGGFVGDARSCTFKNCKNAATVSAIGYVAYSGGLAGNAYECTFDDACANTGSITSSHASWVWGIHASGDLCAKTNEPWLRPNGNAIHRP